MSITELFIRRPVATALLALGLMLLGIFSFLQLPIAPLPSVDFPSINVQARLPGADPETMAATVAAPLERRLGTIPGVMELTSTNATGSSNVTALFDLNRNIEGAARDVQQAITASGSDLPVDLPSPPTYRKLNPADAPILILAITSEQLTSTALYDAVDSILAQRISQVDGVGQVQVSGADKPAVRIQVNPTALASTGLDLEHVRTTIDQLNSLAPKGMINGPKQALAISTNSEAKTAADYRPLILGTNDSQVLRLSDIASVTDSVENVRQAGWYNLDRAILLFVSKQPNANVIETVDHIQSILPQLQQWMPAGTSIRVMVDRTQTIRASVFDVELALMISTLLVIWVVWFSLGRAIPTIAASITVPLSLAGTFAAMHALGFSLNNISLMALTVCVGFVIDDAIVMIENIAHYIERGMAPIEAAIKGSAEITFTVISISLSLIAVFIPILFMGGIVGRMFQEFAVTLTVAVAISVLVSLTVTPTVYAWLMEWHRRRGTSSTHKTHWGERVFNALQQLYLRGLSWVLRYQGFTLIVMLGTIVLTVWLYGHVHKGFFPQQDTGVLRGTVEARTDISFQAMAEKQQAVNRILLEDAAVAGVASSIGTGGGGPNSVSNQGRMFIALKPLSERRIGADAVIARMRPKLAQVEGASIFLQSVQDLNVGGRSSKTQFQFVLSDDSLEELREWTPKLIDALKAEPGITDVTSDQDAAAQQLNIIVDRDRAARLGVDMSMIDQMLQNAFAQRQISTIYKQRNQYRVVLELAAPYQQDATALDHIFLKSASGAVVRLNEIATFAHGFSPLSVQHQGQSPAATLSFNLGEGASLGDATKRIEEVATTIGLPETVRHNFAGNAAAFADSSKGQPLLILSAFLAIYLVLGVLYENTLHPLTILSTLPSAGLGALLALWITGFDLSIISMIGVILLMGIVKKNGIMLVDYAITAERSMPPQEAIVEACRRRFRPILMTTLAALMGALPLILGSGNGAELRQPLGISIAGGLIVSQMLTLYTTPVVFLCLDRSRLRLIAWWRGLPIAGRIAAVIYFALTNILGLWALCLYLWRRYKNIPVSP